MLKAVIIGFGRVGESFVLAAKRRKDIEITAVCDTSPGRLSVADAKYGLQGFVSHKKIYNLKPDLVIISSTNYFHKEHVLEAAKNRVHLLCEKPLALSLRDAEAMASAVKKARVINVVNYSYRFTAYMQAAKRFIDSGRAGKVISIWSRIARGSGLYSSGTRHWAVVEPRLSGGWTLHHASHSADLMLWFGGKIRSVYARMHSTAKIRSSEEVIWAMLEFKNGATGVLGDSIVNYEDSEFGVICEKGTLFIDKNKTIKYKPETGKEYYLDKTLENIPFEKKEILYNSAVLDYFLNHIKKRKQAKVDIAEAVESLKVCLAMKKSASTGRIVKL